MIGHTPKSEKYKALELAASDYADELIRAKTIKDYEKSWMEAVYLYVAQSDAVKEFHHKQIKSSPKIYK